jgi:cyclic pyranopterin phosphate synthase
MKGLFDSYHRHIDYLRISITDRCNLRCFYCSDGSFPHLPRHEVLSYEEIQRVVQAAATLGVKKVRLTGGEPLVRPNLERLVELLASIEGVDDISLTTNGLLLAHQATLLKEAGLKRVNISLDTLNRERFIAISGHDRLGKVLAGIEVARQIGLDPVKINTVVLKGTNDDEILDFARKTVDDDWHVRFIEYMPILEKGNDLSRLVVVSDMMRLIEENLGILKPCRISSGAGPAQYYCLPGAKGTIGFIRPLSECFCDNCNRFRLTSEGQLHPCLLSDDEVDLKKALREGASIGELVELIEKAVSDKPQQHYLPVVSALSKRQMRQIGG